LRARSAPRKAGASAAVRDFPASLEEIPRVVAFVLGRVRRRLAPESAARLELAVEEWAANVCTHAYAGAGGTLGVSVAEAGGRIVVEMSDEGRSFDPTVAEEPDVTAPLADRRPGGLGVLLIRRMLDDVRYRRDGRRNVVTFSVPR
jgi:anti-sigma regulatory factor (Ser/Thr protein kinase)